MAPRRSIWPRTTHELDQAVLAIEIGSTSPNSPPPQNFSALSVFGCAPLLPRNGPTGLNIFLRRVQWLWSVAFPFVDDKTGLALKKIGLPNDPEELRDVVDKHWNKVDKTLLADEDEAARKRRALVIVLDLAIGVDLDSKSDAVLEAAAAAY